MRIRRTEDLGIVFKVGLAEGWAFGVDEAFKDALDIHLHAYVDSERTRVLQARWKEKGGGRPKTYGQAFSVDPQRSARSALHHGRYLLP